VKYSEVEMSQERSVPRESRLEVPVFTNFDGQKVAIPKSTFAALSEAMLDAASSLNMIDSTGRNGPLAGAASERLCDQLFLSPRLSQWRTESDDEGVCGYWLQSKDQTVTITVRANKTVMSAPDRDNPRYPFNCDVITGLPAQTLFKSIQDAQAIVQPINPSPMAAKDDGEEFFGDDPEFDKGAGLDAALEDTHAEPLVEDDAELIEEVCTADEEEVLTPAERLNISASMASVENQAEAANSFTAKANRQNAVTDGVICSYCGNLNQSTYKGTCPKCPKKQAPVDVSTRTRVEIVPPQSSPWVTPEAAKPQSGRDGASEAWLMGRLKSLQGRVLTILDASPIADKAQRDAVKSLLNKEFRREMNKVSDGGWRVGDPRYEE